MIYTQQKILYIFNTNLNLLNVFFNLLNQLKLKYDKGEFNTSQYEQEILLLGEAIVKGTPFESTFKLASNFNAKMIDILYNLNLNEAISILSTSTLNSTAEYIEVILEQLKLHY